MPNNLSNIIILVGAGNMAYEYTKVLKALCKEFVVFGRGIKSSKEFEEKTGTKVILQNIKEYLNKKEILPKYAIIAVSLDQLASKTKELIDLGIQNILVEKPGGLTFEEIYELKNYVAKSNSQIFIAYNRRFYSSVIEAKKIIENDGGVLSFYFEFTEWAYVIESYNFSKEILANWFLANSTHVIDLAFYLGSKPKEISTYTSGSLSWHPLASIFSGAGIAENGALFNYQANWVAPGRWGVEILTKKHRLILRPLEKLQIQNIGSINIDFFELEDELDKKFKPGLFCQTKSFIDNHVQYLPTIMEHANNCRYYAKIIG